MKLGAIILYKNIDAFLSRVQRVVVNTIYSHSSIYIGINQVGRMEEYEANIQFDTTTLHLSDNTEVCNVLADEDIIKEAINYVMDEYEEKPYGFMSWPAILIRRIFEMIGFNNAKKWNILWGWRVECSGLVHLYWFYIASRKGWEDLKSILLTYNSNTFTPEDVNFILDKYDNIYFERIAALN